MARVRIAVLCVSAGVLAAAWFPAWGQSVVSTHSGLVYFFEGAVFLGDQPLEQKFGKFPDIGAGRELRTERGRAEVLLTPGVVLRMDENSAIRMLATGFSDTRVELREGSAIVESNQVAPGTTVRLIYKDWQVRIPAEAVCRMDTGAQQVRVYKGEAEVSNESQAVTVAVREGEVLPLAPVLVPEVSSIAPGDDFKNWAMSRSQSVASDNATAAAILDDPSRIDGFDDGLAGLSYFPLTGIPGVAATHPYGLSFWSPFQSTLSSIYSPPYFAGALYGGWPVGIRYRPWHPFWMMNSVPAGTGPHSGILTSRGVYGSPSRNYNSPPPRVPVNPIGRHPGARPVGHR